MTTQQQYYQDHLIAKVIVYLLYVAVGIASIELATPYIALLAGTFIWLFGINTMAYLVECAAGRPHNHRPL